jgi:hypothetical protein
MSDIRKDIQKVVVAYFELLFQHLPGGNTCKTCKDSHLLSWELNPGNPEHELRLLTTQI